MRQPDLALATAPESAPRATPEMDAGEFHRTRRFAPTRFGRIAYVERGSGPAAIFLHGLPLNGFHWRGSLARLAPLRRCIALDFMGLGYTEVSAAQELSPAAQAEMVAAFMDALSLPAADLVANDSGGAVAQLLAARHPERVRTMLLTNCDVHENCPPALLRPVVEAARAGVYAEAFAPHLHTPGFARSADGIGSITYTDAENLADESVGCYFAPLLATPERRTQLERYIAAFDPNPLPGIEPLLRRSSVPVRMVWGTGDPLFGVEWAEWLHRTLPGSRGVRRVPGAKLFFPEEMPELIAEEARALWAAAPPETGG